MVTFQGKNFGSRVDYHTIRSYRSAKDIVGIGEVNDNYLILFVDSFPDANEAIRFESQGLRVLCSNNVLDGNGQ